MELFSHPLLLWCCWGTWGAAIAVAYLHQWKRVFSSKNIQEWRRRDFLSLATLLLAPALMLVHIGWIVLLLLQQMRYTLKLLSKWTPSRKLAYHLLERPAQLISLSFLGLIALGALLLRFPSASTTHHSISWLQAIFTSTSASCVTGLALLDTPNDFSLFGQIIILLLIQIGGLGTMTLSSFIIWILGQRLGLLSRTALGELLDEPSPSTVLQLLKTIMVATLVLEFIGACILFLCWYHPNTPIMQTAYISLFHAISAFCNAGFALWSNSLMLHQQDVVVNVTIMALIFAGGLGFPVYASLISPIHRRHLSEHKHKNTLFQRAKIYLRTLPLNTKLIIWAHPLLFLLAFILFLPLEWHHSLDQLSVPNKLLAGLFQSVTLRTAGFNTIDFAYLSQSTLFVMIMFMMIGGCSGGTAGGVKVNTLFVILLSLRAIIRDREYVEVYGRRLPQQTITRATIVFFVFFALFCVSTLMMLVTNPHIPFAHAMFEVVSALGTVGLTTATPDGTSTTSSLNVAGQLLITLLMFIGRIGPLTMAIAISDKPKQGKFQFPRERIYVG
jgi:trk system potassium uptake protein TrkH